MAASPLRRWLGVGALLVIVAVGLYMLWPRLFPAKVDDISPRTDQPELPPIKVAAGDWPWWRGPTRDNISPDSEGLTSWTDSDVAWKRAIPGRGHSSPILVGKHVILTTAEENPARQVVLALDRSTGEPLWQTTVHEGGLMQQHGENSHASGTPACDGERIFCQFLNGGSQWLSALDLAGNILWKREAGPHKGRGSFGSGPSPALWGSLVIVAGDAPEAGFIAAVHRQTGEIVWRKARPTGQGSYGSPLVAEIGGKARVLLAGYGKLTAYDPATGEAVWNCDGLSDISANTPVLAGELVIGSTGSGDGMVAARADGTRVWQTTRASEVPYVCTPLYHDGFLYYVSRGTNSMICMEAATGKQRWDVRLRGQVRSSPLLVGKNIYIAGQPQGEVLVFKANPEAFERVAENKVDAGVYASPVAVGGKLFIRTEHSLYCIGK